MKRILFVFTIFLLVEIGSATPFPMGTLTNNDTFLKISTYDGSNQLVHPCVIYNASGWNGYHYLMAMTPYPNSNSNYENPSMRYSNDGFTWVQIPGQPDPIITKPAKGYNSDPNIELVGNTLFLFYRYVNVTESAEVWYNYTSTTDGVTWTTPVKLNMDKIRSGSFVYNGTGWESWGHNTTTLNLVHYTSSTITTWSAPQAITVDSTGYIQCHSEVKLYDGQYQLLLSDNPFIHLRFYTSSDGLTWNSENTNNPVLTGRTGYWDEKIYKSSFVKTNDLYKVWYGGFTNSWVAKVGYTQYPSLDRITSISVTSPNGGETWQRGTTHTVTWDYTGSPGSLVKIVVSKAGIEVGTINASTSIGSGGKGSYLWAIPSTGSTGSDNKVSVQSISQSTIKDVSNNYFTITSAITTPLPVLTVSASPTLVKVGNPTNVNFTVKNQTSGLVVNGALVILTGVAAGSNTTGADGNVTISVNAGNVGAISAIASQNGYSSGTTTVTAIYPNPAPIAGFTVNTNTGASRLVVTFTDTSSGSGITKWNWSFGDGTWENRTSSTNPGHKYGVGTWYPTLTVTNASGGNTSVITPERTITFTPATFPASTKIGVYQNGAWFLDNDGSGTWNAGDKSYNFGAPGWIPIVGDWNATGKSYIGVTNGQQWYLDWNGNGGWDGADKAYSFGAPGWINVTGDWNHDGKTEIGVTNGQQWYLDNNGNGAWDNGIDSVYSFGSPGWIPIVGDWNATGYSFIGVTNGQQWYLDWNGNGVWDETDRAYNFGAPGWTPLVGDWNATGKSNIGVTNGQQWYLDWNGNGAWEGADRASNFGAPGWIPKVGDWNGDAIGTKIGIYKDGKWYLDSNGNGVWDNGVDYTYSFGAPGWTPVVGKCS